MSKICDIKLITETKKASSKEAFLMHSIKILHEL